MQVRTILCVLLLVFEFAFLMRLVLSFFPLAEGSAWANLRGTAVTVTEPVVMPIRRAVPPLPGALGGFGIAELLVLIGIQILARIIC